MKREYTQYDKYIAYLEVIGAFLIVGFWIGWFFDLLKSSLPDPLFETYLAFESAFPIPDAWIVILLLISAYGILAEKSFGSFFAAAAGGALMFLGLIDISFNLQQGIYQYDFLAIPINLATTIGGGTLLAWFARYHFKFSHNDV
ncbi:MAG: hypothetical protein ACFFC6_07860 [Promethearchaeota archaeon]